LGRRRRTGERLCPDARVDRASTERHTRVEQAVGAQGRRDRRRATPGRGGNERFGVEPKTVPPSPAQALMERRQRLHRILALLGWLAVGGAAAHAQRASRAVYLDNQGVVRWKDDRQEV